MPTRPDIHRLIALQQLLLQFRTIERRLPLPPTIDTFENDAEHSYALAMAGWFLAPHFPTLDQDKIIRLCLAHDLVEVHAGDVYAYTDDKTALDDKAQLEQKALQKLAAEWQDFPELISSIREYEQRQAPEAKFVYALDKIMPALVDFINEGRGWRHLNITHEKFQAEKERKIPISPEINTYKEELYELLERYLHFFPKGPDA